MIYLVDYIFDLVQNSIKADASNILISLDFNKKLSFILEDDGKGMSEDILNQVKQFTYSSQKNRKVGLGLSMIHDLANQTDGSFDIKSIKEKGTKLSLTFNQNHIDFPEIGDIGLMVSDLYINKDVNNLILQVKYNKTYTFELLEYIKDKNYGFKTKKEIEYLVNQKIAKIKDGL